MPRLFHKGEWFYELAPTSLSEKEFEGILVQNVDIIRPNSAIVPFKKTVYAGNNSAQADLAIISNDYRDWLVVEVEMVRHSLYHHVVPQVRTLRGASYGAAEAEYLAARNSMFDPAKLTDVMRGEPPIVVVIVNKPDADWERELRWCGASVMVFEIYRSDLNRYVFSIDGELPQLAHDVITLLEFDRLLPRFLTVASPAKLNFQIGQRLPIFINEQLTEWERVDIQTTCYITPVGRMPLAPGHKYALVQTAAGQYAIRPVA
jgi:hypothetical protein